MIAHIAGRELRELILGWRFYGAAAFFLVLAVAGAWVLGQEQAHQRQTLGPFLDETRYRQAVEGGNAARLIGGGVFASRPLPPLRGLARGLEDLSLVAQVKGGNYILYLRRPFIDNPTDRLFGDFDLVFAIGAVLSLVALAFTYDAVAGERQRGTLRLVLAYGVGRGQVLAGKFVGAVAALAMVLAPALVGALLAGRWTGGLVVEGDDWATVALLAGAGLLYAAVFAALGLWASCACAEARTALVGLLAAWVLLVWVVPGLGVHLASRLVGAPSWLAVEADINRVRAEAEREGWEEVKAYIAQQPWNGVEGADWNLAWGSWSDMVPRLWGKISEEEWRELSLVATQVMRRQLKEMEEESGRLKAAYLVRRQREAAWGRTLASVSPAGAFTLLATDLCRTGVGAEEAFRQRVERFKGQMVGYLYDQLAERTLWDEVDATAFPHLPYRVGGRGAVGVYALVLAVYGVLLFLAAHRSLDRSQI